MSIVKTGSGRQKKILLLRVCSILSFLSSMSRGYKGKPSMTGVVPGRGRLSYINIENNNLSFVFL